MESNQENKEVTQEESVEGVEQKEEKKENTADRPAINYEAELSRKNAEIARLRREQAERELSTPRKRDQADITTWSNEELDMLRKSSDPSVAQWKNQAEDVLLERKVKAIQAREYEYRRKEEINRQLENEYPESADPTSEFSVKLEKTMRDFDLHKTPAGRLAAAKIVAAEEKSSKAKGTNKEDNRVTRVKSQMVDGDRPKPTEGKNPNQEQDLKKKLLNEKSTSHDATSEWIDSRGLREKFGKVWGQ